MNDSLRPAGGGQATSARGAQTRRGRAKLASLLTSLLLVACGPMKEPNCVERIKSEPEARQYFLDFFANDTPQRMSVFAEINRRIPPYKWQNPDALLKSLAAGCPTCRAEIRKDLAAEPGWMMFIFLGAGSYVWLAIRCSGKIEIDSAYDGQVFVD